MPQNSRTCLLRLFATVLFLHWARIIGVWFFKESTKTQYTKREVDKIPSKPDTVKYLSYQPPGAGWNNQRIVLENAIVIAKLLNRTLIVRPVAPHAELFRIQKASHKPASYGIYNQAPQESLIPLSKVIDIKQLRKLLNVVEDRSDNSGFERKYRNKTWHYVCHNPKVGFWVDNLPSVYQMATWSIIKAQSVVSRPVKLPPHKQICKDDIEEYTRNPARFLVWGLKNELSKVDADLIFFSEGSLLIRRLYFMDSMAARIAKHWLRKYVNFSYWIRKNARKIVNRIGVPFNAVHIRRTDLKKTNNFTQEFWLNMLENIDPLKMTKKLYVATDEHDKAWFAPFRNRGYKLYFAGDFIDILGPFLNETKSNQDLLGLHEQLICARARKFVHSYYSSFSLYIRRTRNKFHAWEGWDTFWPKWIGDGIIVKK